MVEALAALLIAAGAIASLHALHITLIRDSRLAAEHSFASAWAEQGLETTLTVLRAGALVPGLETSRWPPADDTSDPQPVYWRQIELTAAGEALRVEISVAWPHPDAPPPRRILMSATVRPGAAADSGRIPDSSLPVISP